MRIAKWLMLLGLWAGCGADGGPGPSQSPMDMLANTSAKPTDGQPQPVAGSWSVRPDGERPTELGTQDPEAEGDDPAADPNSRGDDERADGTDEAESDPPAPAACGADSSGVVVLAGLVVDKACGRLYLMAPGVPAMGVADGVLALDAGTGAVLWRSELAEAPVALGGGELLALDAQQRLIGLDPGTGQPTGTAVDVSLLAGGLRLTSGFGLDARWHGYLADGDLIFTWHARSYCLSGTPDGCAGAVDTVSAGTLRIDLAAATATEIAPADAPPERAEPPAALALPAGVGEVLRVADPRLIGPPPPLYADPDAGVYAAIELTRTAPVVGVLRRYRADGTELEERPLPADLPIRMVRVSADERHAAVFAYIEGSMPAAFRAEIVELSTGTALGPFTTEHPAEPFVLMGGVVVTPDTDAGVLGDQKRVRALALDEGTERWSEPMRAVVYVGPQVP